MTRHDHKVPFDIVIIKILLCYFNNLSWFCGTMQSKSHIYQCILSSKVETCHYSVCVCVVTSEVSSFVALHTSHILWIPLLLTTIPISIANCNILIVILCFKMLRENELQLLMVLIIQLLILHPRLFVIRDSILKFVQIYPYGGPHRSKTCLPE